MKTSSEKMGVTEKLETYKFLCENYIPGTIGDSEVSRLLKILGLEEDPNNPFALQDILLVEFDRAQTEYAKEMIQ